MSLGRRLLLVAGALVALVALFVLLRARGDDDAATGAAETEPATKTLSVPGQRNEGARSRRVARPLVTVRIAVRNGRVVGGLVRRTVVRHDPVVLVVSSDSRDHVHLHGYDLMRNVAPRVPARLQFRARLAGRFEIELEDAGLQIGELRVQP